MECLWSLVLVIHIINWYFYFYFRENILTNPSKMTTLRYYLSVLDLLSLCAEVRCSKLIFTWWYQHWNHFRFLKGLLWVFFPTICIIVVYVSGVKKSAAPRSGTGGLWVRTWIKWEVRSPSDICYCIMLIQHWLPLLILLTLDSRSF